MDDVFLQHTASARVIGELFREIFFLHYFGCPSINLIHGCRLTPSMMYFIVEVANFCQLRLWFC